MRLRNLRYQATALLLFATTFAIQPPKVTAQTIHDGDTLRIEDCEDNHNSPHGCGTWVFTGSHGHGYWPDGTSANLELETFTENEIKVSREDTEGLQKGIKAVYTGVRTGDHIEGTVSWTWPKHIWPLAKGTIKFAGTIQGFTPSPGAPSSQSTAPPPSPSSTTSKQSAPIAAPTASTPDSQNKNSGAAAENSSLQHRLALFLCDTKMMGGSEMCFSFVFHGNTSAGLNGSESGPALNVERMDASGVVMTIKFPAEFSGTYKGTLEGEWLHGTSAWTGPMGTSAAGEWKAFLVKALPDDAIAGLPESIRVCERKEKAEDDDCFDWERQGQSINTTWGAGEITAAGGGVLKVVGFDSQRQAIAIYDGKLSGKRVAGTVTWINGSGDKELGRWKGDSEGTHSSARAAVLAAKNGGAPAVSMPKGDSPQQSSAAPAGSGSDERQSEPDATAAEVDPAKLPKALQICTKLDGEETEKCDLFEFHPENGSPAPHLTARRFDAGGVILTYEHPTLGRTMYKGHFEGKDIVGTVRMTAPTGEVQKGTWHTKSYQGPAQNTAVFNVYVTQLDHVGIINSATHAAKVVTLPPKSIALDIAVSQDGSKAYVATKDGPIYVIDGATASIVKKFNMTETKMGFGFAGIAISPDGNTIYGTGGLTPQRMNITGFGIGVMDASTGTLTRTFDLAPLRMHGSQTPGTMVFVDGKVYGVFGEALVAVDVNTGKMESYEGHEDYLAVAGNRKYVYTSQIAIDTATGKAAAVGLGDVSGSGGIAVSPDGSTAYRSNGLNQICVIDMKVGNCRSEVQAGFRPQGIAITPDGKTLFAGTMTGIVLSIDTKSNEMTDSIALWSGPLKTSFPIRVAVQPPPYQ